MSSNLLGSKPLSALEPLHCVLKTRVFAFILANMALNVELSVRLRQILTDNNFPVAVIEKLRELQVAKFRPRGRSPPWLMLPIMRGLLRTRKTSTWL